MDNQNMPRVTEQADERALFMRAIDSTYPVPNTPHQSVAQRAMDNREAFSKGWDQARAAITRQAAPVAPTGDSLTPQSLVVLRKGLRDWETPENRYAAQRILDAIEAAPATQQAGAADCDRCEDGRMYDTSHTRSMPCPACTPAATMASASEPDVFSCARAIPGSYSSACEAYCGDESKCISADCGIKRPNPVREAGDVPTKETLIAQPTEEMLSAMVERAANWGMNIDPRIAAALYRAALARAPLPAQGDTKPVSAGAKLYRKTALVQAEQFLPAEGKIPDGVISDGNGDPRKNSRYSFVLDTKEGRHYLRNGDYICTGPSGEKWNVERGIFESTYELADAAPAQAGDALDAARLDWLNQNFFSDQKDEWDERLAPDSIKWKFFGPMSVQGDVRRVIDAAMSASQGTQGEKNV